MAPHPLTCPFCGVLCDDLRLVDPDGDASQVMTHGCALAAQQFEAARQLPGATARALQPPPGERAPASWLEARRVTADEALAAVADRLAHSHRPAIVCAACDVATARAASALASRLGAVLDDGARPADRAARSATSRIGLSTATLSELRNRADTVVLLGETPLAGMPRLVERYLAPPPLLGGRPERRFVSIGPADASLPDPLGPVAHLDCQPAQLDEVLGRIQRRLSTSPDPPQSAAPADPALEAVVQALLTAGYAAWVWQPATLGPDADLIVERVASILAALNAQHHHVGVPLVAPAGGGTAAQTITWQTGLLPPVALAHLGPRHDPAASRAADFRLWLSPLSPAPPPASQAPTVVFGHPATPPDAAQIVIPVGIPGVDHPGYVFTADGSEVRHLSHFLSRGLPPAENLLTRLRALCPPPS